MFNKLKQFKDLRDQAKVMQQALAQEIFKEEKNGISITLNGNMEVIEVNLNEHLSQTATQDALKNCFNEAIKKAQRVMAKKLQDMGGMDGLLK